MFAYWPGNVSIERWHLWVQSLVAADERVFVDLPDFSVVVPGAQVVGQVLGITLHARTDHRLDLLRLVVSRHQLMDWLLRSDGLC